MRVKQYTHRDLDGYMSAVLGMLAFHIDVEVEFGQYDSINESITEFITSGEYKKFDAIHITDLSVSPEVAKMLDEVYNSELIDVFLFDHHKTALWLNDEYPWAIVKTHRQDGRMACGASIYYEYLTTVGYIQSRAFIDEVVELTRLYDTWEWKEYGINDAKDLNTLVEMYGREEFIAHIYQGCLYHINDNQVAVFNETDNLLIQLRNQNYQSYKFRKGKCLRPLRIYGYLLGVVHAEQYVSELGNDLAEENPQYDIIAMINGDSSVSYRTVKDNVDVSAFAKKFGGGGHPKASGSPIPKAIQDKLLVTIFS